MVSSSDTPCAREVGEHVVDALAALRIDADRRLVEQHDARPVEDAAGDVEAPLHAAGELLDRLAARSASAGALERPVDLRRSVRAGEPLQLAEGASGSRARSAADRARSPAARCRAPAACGGRRAARRTGESRPRRAARGRRSRGSGSSCPAPFGPSSASSSPLRRSREAPSSALTAPNDFRAFGNRQHVHVCTLRWAAGNRLAVPGEWRSAVGG